MKGVGAGGGLDAIVFADVIQTCIFMTGGLLASYYAMAEVGGFEGLWQSANDFELDEGYFMSTWRPIEQPPYTGPGLLTGYLCLLFWYWVIDQEMAQRVIGAKTVAHARVGSLMAATLKLTTPFIVVIPGALLPTHCCPMHCSPCTAAPCTAVPRTAICCSEFRLQAWLREYCTRGVSEAWGTKNGAKQDLQIKVRRLQQLPPSAAAESAVWQARRIMRMLTS